MCGIDTLIIKENCLKNIYCDTMLWWWPVIVLFLYWEMVLALIECLYDIVFYDDWKFMNDIKLWNAYDYVMDSMYSDGS